MQWTRPKAVVAVATAAMVLSWAFVLGRGPSGASWERDLPAYPRASNSHLARTIIHMHSVYSHDACDGHPLDQGRVNEPCLASLRQAVCRDHVDFLFLTEHGKFLNSTEFNSILNPRDGDSLIWQDGHVVESIQHCPDGHDVHVLPGAEDNVMPLGITRHPDASGPLGASVADWRRTGGLIGLAHVERPFLTPTQIRNLRPDAMEVYNLHANVGATARRRSKWTVLARIFGFLQFLPMPRLEPDLLFLSFFSEDEIALAKWGQVAQDVPVTAIAGTDAHENALPWKMRDGERIDSYRRTMRWFSNFVQVEEFDRDSVLRALKAGNSFVAFEIFGTPIGFDYHADYKSQRFGMGETIHASEATPVTLSMQRPTIFHADPSAPQPPVVLRILRASPDGWEEVAKTEAAELVFVTKRPGAYRAEVRIKPEHLAPYLLGAERLIGYRPWIYANPIYVRSVETAKTADTMN